MTIAEPVIAGVSAFAGGGLGVIAAPWAQWAVEKRRHRRELVEKWRTGIASYIADHAHRETSFGAVPNDVLLISLEWYQSLAGHLTPEVRARAERFRGNELVVEMSDDKTALRIVARAEILRDEVDRIERKWRLT